MSNRYGYSDCDGYPTDCHGRHNNSYEGPPGGRLNQQRLDSMDVQSKLPPGTYFSSSSKPSYAYDDSAPDSPSLGQERYRRGHNPNHYGIHSPKSTCSAPEADDYGFQGEIDPGRPGIRSDRYWAYKAAGNRGSDRHKEYDKARGSMHHGRKKDGPEFVGDPHLRRSDHHTLAGIAGPLLDARLQEQEGRRSFNNDFIGHFEHKQSWQGHRDKVNNVTNSVTKAERFVKSHNV